MKVILFIAILFVAGCRPTAEERSIRSVNDGLPSLQVAREFAALYPDAIHRYIWVGGDWAWIAIAGIHGRYELRIVVPVDVRTFRRVKQVGPASFQVAEIDAVNLTSTLNTKSYTTHQRRLSKEEWEMLRAANGDLTAIGYEVVRTRPVENFEEGLRMF